MFKGNFAKLFVAALLLFNAFYMLLPTLPVYLTGHLGFAKGQIGAVLATYTLAALLIRPLTGFLIDRYGRKKFYITAFAIYAFIFPSYLLAQQFSSMFLLRFVHGLAWGVATTTASTLIVDIVPAHRRGEGIGLYGLSMTIPMALGPLLGIKTVAHWGAEGLFFTSMAIAILAGTVTLLVEYPPFPVNHSIHFSLRNLIEKKSLPSSLNLLMISVSYGGLVSFIALYALETGIGHTAAFFMIFAAGIAIARLVGGRIFDRTGPLRIGLTGISLLVIAFLLLGTAHQLVVFLLAGLIAGLGNGIIFPVFQAMVNNLVSPARRGAANSTLFTGLDLGIGLGMLLTGQLGQAFGFANTYLIFGALNLAALMVFILFTYRHYRQLHP